MIDISLGGKKAWRWRVPAKDRWFFRLYIGKSLTSPHRSSISITLIKLLEDQNGYGPYTEFKHKGFIWTKRWSPILKD